MTTPKQHIAASPFGLFGNPVHPVGPPVLAIAKALKTGLQQRASADASGVRFRKS